MYIRTELWLVTSSNPLACLYFTNHHGYISRSLIRSLIIATPGEAAQLSREEGEVFGAMCSMWVWGRTGRGFVSSLGPTCTGVKDSATKHVGTDPL